MRRDLAKFVGDRVRDLRTDQGITQEAFAERVGISVTFIRRIERGDVKNPSLERLQKIATGLDVPVSQLFVEYDSTDYDKMMLIEQIARMLRLHSLQEIKTVRVILREAFALQRLGRK